MTTNLKALVQKIRGVANELRGLYGSILPDPDTPDWAAERLEECATEIERMESEPRAQEWRPIETAPKEVAVLVWREGWGSPAVMQWCAHDDGDGWYTHYYDYRYEPSHWQPLPEPPK